MYHRIATPQSDVWEISVSPQNFEAHLQLLKKMGNVVTLPQLSDDINAKRLKKNSIAITFDDGYIDNFTTAKPLLEKYGLPATFFISTGNTETNKEFWWDELEQIILFTAHLPSQFHMMINETLIIYDLKSEMLLSEQLAEQHIKWKACTQTSPTTRAGLFYDIWQHLKPLPCLNQQQYLQEIRAWAGVNASTRANYRCMQTAELQQLSANNLFTIGAHTVTHPALAHHTASFQKEELITNKNFLKQITGKPIDFLAYPYGNYSETTISITKDLHFKTAFTTEEKTIKKNNHQFSLGRWQVKNTSGEELNAQLKQMIKC